MGSVPWKRAALWRWENELSGRLVTVTGHGTVWRDDGSTIRAAELTGLFVGHGAAKGQPVLHLHLRPDIDPADPGFFDHQVEIALTRGMHVTAAQDTPTKDAS